MAAGWSGGHQRRSGSWERIGSVIKREEGGLVLVQHLASEADHSTFK